MLTYSWSLLAYGKWGWLAAFLFAVCGALRLARFNVQIGVIDSRVFNGLPIPGGAAAVATGILLYYYLGGEGRFTSLAVMIVRSRALPVHGQQHQILQFQGPQFFLP